MSYLVLARKWRPQGFDDLIGQEPVVRILRNSLMQGKIAHAYVFSGPRGVGKTSTARILSKALNCKEGPTPDPCGRCESCLSVAGGSSVDVHEIDGASNNSVDDVRDLRERVKYAPSGGKSKVYIIDEVHMLSTAAFNALLKTLEEPPPHVVFVLATTEVKKIPATVMSRCQHLSFRRVTSQAIRARLEHIAQAEGLNISTPALAAIARAADGGIRDSLTILDQAISFSSEVTEEDITALLDVSDYGSLSEMARALIAGGHRQIIELVMRLMEFGVDPRGFVKDLIVFFRDMLVYKLAGPGSRALDVSADELSAIEAAARTTTDEHIALVLNELIKAEADVRYSFAPRVALEMALLRISYLGSFREVKKAIASLSGLSPVAIEAASCDDSPDFPRASGEYSAPDGIEGPSAPPPPDAPYRASSAQSTASAPSTQATAPITAVKLLEALVDNSDEKLASMLNQARPSYKGRGEGTLNLSFSGPGADICAEAVRRMAERVSRLASDLRGAPTAIEIHVARIQQTGDKRPARERVLEEPVISEALDLFQGRVLDYDIIEGKE